MDVLTLLFNTRCPFPIPADLRGRLGLGLEDRQELLYLQAQLIRRLACRCPFYSGNVPLSSGLTLPAAVNGMLGSVA